MLQGAVRTNERKNANIVCRGKTTFCRKESNTGTGGQAKQANGWLLLFALCAHGHDDGVVVVRAISAFLQTSKQREREEEKARGFGGGDEHHLEGGKAA